MCVIAIINKDMSIFSKLFKLFITVVLMPLIPMALLLAYYQNRQKDNILETHYNLAEIVSSNIKHYTEDLGWRLSFAQRLPAVLEKEENPVPLLREALNANPDFIFLAVLGSDGKETARAARTAAAEEGEKIDISQDPALPQMARDARIHLTGLETVSSWPVVEMVYPLEDGSFLYGVLGMNDLLDRLQQMRIGRTGQVHLVTPDGQIMLLPYQWHPEIKPEKLQKLFAGENRFIKGLQSNEDTYAGAFAPAAVLDVYVTVLQPQEEAFRSLYFSNVVIFLFLLAIATLAYFGALTFSRSLGEPIAALAKGAEEVSHGNFDHQISEEAAWGELRQLIDSFNKMTSDLKDYQALQLKTQISEMKEQIFRSVAHDLRAPLLGLQGYIYILSSGKITDQQRQEYLQRMDEAAKNLSSLLEDVLSVSRIEAGMTLPQRQHVELAPLLRSVVHTSEPVAAAKGLRLELKTPQDAAAWADPKLLRRIVTNLLSNAVKFTEKGFVEISVEDQPSRTVISVRDSGVGLTEKQCGDIFEKYRQVDDGAEGYGLGLFISRQLARAHGGDLTVSSVLGQGSTFILTLPKEEK